MRHKKAAIELSVNFLVVIVISIIILGLGLALFFNIKNNASDLIKAVDSQTQEQLRNDMLNNNAKVGVYPNNIMVARGKAGTVAIGITNFGNLSDTFSASVTHVKLLSTNNAPAREMTPNDNWINSVVGTGNVQMTAIGSIGPAQQIFKNVLIKMPRTAPSGQYLITLSINKGSVVYDNIIIHVTNP